MSFVTNVLTPIIQTVVYVLVGGGFIFFLFVIFKSIFPNFRYFFKYTIFRRAFKEDYVEYCMDAIKQGKSLIDVKKNLLLQGKRNSEIKEISYIFNRTSELLYSKKGGVKNGRQSKQSDREIKLQKIK